LLLQIRFEAAEILEVVKSYSRQEGTTVIGTDPNEWFEGYDAILGFYAPADGQRLDVKVDVLKAYCEGGVGWTMDRVTVKLPSGEDSHPSYTHFQKK
jgi:hypothetical protein